MSKVTIKDVAREAGVSISTVSNALNNVDVLNPDTKARVLEAAKRLKYIPNLNGKNLKARKNKIIGLYTNSMEGAFYGLLADSISKECEMRDYELIIHVTMNKKRVIRSILGYSEDGVILLFGDLNGEIEESVREYGIPAVFLEKEICGEKMSGLSFDSYGAGRLAAKCLIDAGNKRLGYIHGIEDTYDNDERFRGFLDEINERGAVFDKKAELKGFFNDECTFTAVTEYLKKTDDYVDAFFAANDSSALGCVNAILNAGYSVPGDFSVIGCDGIDTGRIVKPALTTVVNPILEEGKKSIDMLIGLIDGECSGSIEKLPVHLEFRETVGAPNKR